MPYLMAAGMGMGIQPHAMFGTPLGILVAPIGEPLGSMKGGGSCMPGIAGIGIGIPSM